jgi:hypothetical protein
VILFTRTSLDARLAQHRRDLAAQFAAAIETLLPEPCTHRDRPSCPVCAKRRTVFAAAAVVRETGKAAS